jgi:PilZ domain
MELMLRFYQRTSHLISLKPAHGENKDADEQKGRSSAKQSANLQDGSSVVGELGGVEAHKKQTKTSARERRKQERFGCDGFAEVIVDDAGFLFRGAVQDISLSGCYIRSRARLRLHRGAEVDLHFSVNGDYFNARARLMIVRPGAGAGFEFLLDDPELQLRLSSLVRKLEISAPDHAVAHAGKTDDSSKAGPSRDLWNRTR